MKKQLIKVLLCGAVAIVSASMFTSCNTEAIDDLSTRVTVLEGMVRQLESDLQAAMVTGATITNASQDAAGAWTLVLSDGKSIKIDPSTGGASVSVEETADAFIIKVGENAYAIPKGGAGVQLVYSPEYVDGIVKLGNDGATVKFLVNSPINLAATTFDVAEAHEVLTRVSGGSDLFSVKEPKMEGDFLVLTLKGAGCEAGKTYTASIVANIGTSQAISNYFTVEVADDFIDNSEQIGDFAINAQYNPSEINEQGFCSVTVPGEVLVGGFDFLTIFDQKPEGAKIEIAKSGSQPGGKAQEKYALIAEALGADGIFAWKHAPRTDFNVDEQHGFLIKLVANDVTKAKVYVQIDNPLANPDINWFPGFGGQFECEWHSRTEPLGLGAQTIDLQYIFNVDHGKVYLPEAFDDSQTTNPDYEINLIFGGQEFFQAYTSCYVSLPGDTDKTILEFNGEKLAPGDYGKKFLCPDNEGIGWFNRNLNVSWSGDEVPGPYVWDNDEGGECAGQDAVGIDWWWGDPNGNPLNIQNEANALVKYYGIYIDHDGVFHTNEKYTGFPMRLGIGAYFDYAYGTKCLKPDQFGLMFINRRRAPEGMRLPDKKRFNL